MEQKEQVNKLARAFGSALIEKGIQILQTAYRGLSPKQYTKAELADILRGTGFNFPVSLSDEKYYAAEWSTWRAIQEFDWIHKMRYFSDKFDCDNFAFLFSAIAAVLYGLNTTGVAYGQVFDATTQKFISGHAWNVILVSGGELYCYEPMNNRFALIRKGDPIIINKWEYRPNWILFY